MDPQVADDKTAAVRRFGLGNVLLAGLVLLAVTATGGPAAAQNAGNGLDERSVNSFRFDPGLGVVRVTIDVDLRNTTTDRVEGDVVSRTYFDNYSVAVPLGAENIVAIRDGTVLDGSLVSDPEFPAFSTYRFALGTELFSGQSTTVRVTYDHLGAPPRDPVPWRINEAYAGFVAFGLGDEGLVTLVISQPAGYEFDEFTDLSGFDVSEPDEFGTVVHTRSGLDDDTRVTVGMANDDRLVSRPLDVEGVDLELRSWPDDPEWAEFAAARVEAGIPALEELIGSDWPVDGSFDVRQTVEPNLRGYAGWFDAQSNEIAVGEALDADTIYHELSHAWFNRRMSTERWLTEGLAQAYAAELVSRDGDEARTPSEPDPGDPAARPLTDWAALDSERTADSERAVEEFGYAASFWVVDALVDEIGFDRTAAVIATLQSGTSPYGEADDAERPDADWKRVYDAFVEIGGASVAGDVFRAHVVAAGDATSIERRDRAGADVAALMERSSPWDLPVGVRNRLERWEIDDVIDGLLTADLVLDQRSQLESLEASVGLDEPDRAGEAFAAAPMRGSGGVDFSEATAMLDEAIGLGGRLEDLMVQIDALQDTAGATPPELSSVPGVDDFTSGLETAEAQLRALQRIVEIEARLDAVSGFAATVGRWGSDIGRDVDEARAQVERGDSEAALATLGSAEERIDDLAAAGILRLAIVGGLVLALLVAFALIRRRRRTAGVDTETTTAEAGRPTV
ncbi:MAG TPA: hypothetical protein VLN74_07130 [Ilumatobacteraceae bacterium]|nr:hypothetical protein [Ilumatobacteraceae bacterium]